MKTILLGCLLAAVFLPPLSARTWTNRKGQSVEGDLVRMDGDAHVLVKIGIKEHRLAVSSLSEADQKWLKEHQQEEKQSGGSGEATLLGVKIKKGRNEIPMDTSSYPFSDENREHSAKSTIFLYVPEGFDPTKKYNLMLTLGTTSGKGSKQGNSIRHFADPGIANGWVVMTSDNVNGRPPDYSLEWRVEMIDAALDVLNKEWPASLEWNICAGGSSGGAKAAQGVLAVMGSKQYGNRRIAGLFLTGCNQQVYTWGEGSSKPSRKTTRNVAVFFSQGKNDKTAPPDRAKLVLEELKDTGIRTQKYVEFDGGHGVHAPHIAEAFRWLGEHCAGLEY